MYRKFPNSILVPPFTITVYSTSIPVPGTEPVSVLLPLLTACYKCYPGRSIPNRGRVIYCESHIACSTMVAPTQPQLPRSHIPYLCPALAEILCGWCNGRSPIMTDLGYQEGLENPVDRRSHRKLPQHIRKCPWVIPQVIPVPQNTGTEKEIGNA